MAGSGNADLPRAGQGRGPCRGRLRAKPRPGRGRRARADLAISGQRRRLRLRRDRRRGRRAPIDAVAERFGRLDILVNDAAYNKAIPFADLDSLTMEVWDRIIAVNLTGPMRLIKAVAPIMKAQGTGPHRQYLVGVRGRADRLVDRLCGLEGGAHSPDALHGGGAGAGDAGQLRRAGPSRGHPRDREPAARADPELGGDIAAEKARRQG